MDSGSQAAVYGSSGGKILKQRSTSSRNTPYERPTPKPQPNWLNALVSPVRSVSYRAGRLISSFWNPNTWASNSYCSVSDSDEEGGIGDFERDDGAELNQNTGSSSGKSEVLYLVEQLLMLDRFSREECDRLIKIINLRVEDYTMGGVDAGPSNPTISNRVIMEARKMITQNTVGSSLKSDLDNSIHGSKSLLTPNRDYQRLHSKAIALWKPNQLLSLAAPKPGTETANIDPKDTKTTREHVPTEALSSLPIIEKKRQIAEAKDKKNDKTGDDVNHVEGDLDMITEYAEVTDAINASQGSSNTIDPTSSYITDSPTGKRAATRTRKYSTRRGRPRSK